MISVIRLITCRNMFITVTLPEDRDAVVRHADRREGGGGGGGVTYLVKKVRLCFQPKYS